jgi:hypothetical protein
MNRARFEEGLRLSNIPVAVGYLLALLGHLHILVNHQLHSRPIRDIDVTPYFQASICMHYLRHFFVIHFRIRDARQSGIFTNKLSYTVL